MQGLFSPEQRGDFSSCFYPAPFWLLVLCSVYSFGLTGSRKRLIDGEFFGFIDRVGCGASAFVSNKSPRDGTHVLFSRALSKR